MASESWEEADATFRTIVAELDLYQALPQHLIAFAQAHGYAITPLPPVLQDGLEKRSRYAAARRNGVDTVLEIRDLTVNLAPAEYMVNPHHGLTLSTRLQLIRMEDEAVLDDRVMTDQLGPALLLDEWTTNNAAPFRQEVLQATERLAEQIITDYFMLYTFPERVTSGFFWAVHLKGLRPLYPLENPNPSGSKVVREKDIQAKYIHGFLPSIPSSIVAAQRSHSLQPPISWEQFPGSNVTYDLKIWRSGRLGPDAIVYSRTNLDQASHKLEQELEPSTLYYWSVRAHFSEHGTERITEWSRRSVKYSVWSKILTWGMSALLPDPVAEGFYVFVTPPSPSHSP